MFSLSRNFAVNSSEGVLQSSPSIQERQTFVAAQAQGAGGAGGGGIGGGKMGVGQSITSTNVNLMLLDGILSDDRTIRNRIFKDIYFHDPVGGGAVDVMSTLPFGEFHLTGLSNKARLQKFAESTAMIHPQQLLPLISRQYLTLGQYLGTKNWDKKKKLFTGVVSHDIESVKTINIPVTGATPIFDLTLNQDFIRLMQNSSDPRIKKVIDQLPETYKQALKQGVLQLEPQNTIFVARRTLAGDIMGTSLFERMLPVHLVEKAIFRGTIDAANRRQRAILHVQLGGDDDWVPNPSDLDAARTTFLQADMDPQGAIVATRTGVSVNEIRQPTDFWTAEMIDQWTAQVKYRAIGISDDIITGVASLSTLDASMSIIVTNLRNFRKFIELEVFTHNLFADIAIANDFTKKGGHTVLGSTYDTDIRDYTIGAGAAMGVRNYEGRIINISDYDIPRIVWHQALSPEGDSAYMEILNTARQSGVPVPLSYFAAAAGLNLNEILNEEKNDLDTRKKVSVYFEKIRELDPQANGDQVTAALATLAKFESLNSPGFSKRETDHDQYFYNTDNLGRRIFTTPQERKRREERTMRLAAKALAKNAERQNHSIRITPKNTTTTTVDFGANK